MKTQNKYQQIKVLSFTGKDSGGGKCIVQGGGVKRGWPYKVHNDFNHLHHTIVVKLLMLDLFLVKVSTGKYYILYVNAQLFIICI